MFAHVLPAPTDLDARTPADLRELRGMRTLSLDLGLEQDMLDPVPGMADDLTLLFAATCRIAHERAHSMNG